ncbi:hypothetical protein BCON_0257g00190 [Botryotinia convoluta]|uniref:Uncharacterized protein n=1 Tax=Botryotinia convoluta TaxID=54673 RepID=A0A4Z1HSX0_9HELO|nr:hypothetical protein BCON_0257g00190 [Botryotinia convoluta]
MDGLPTPQPRSPYIDTEKLSWEVDENEDEDEDNYAKAAYTVNTYLALGYLLKLNVWGTDINSIKDPS